LQKGRDRPSVQGKSVKHGIRERFFHMSEVTLLTPSRKEGHPQFADGEKKGFSRVPAFLKPAIRFPRHRGKIEGKMRTSTAARKGTERLKC